MDSDELELLNEAREILETQETVSEKLRSDILICECNCISVGEIRQKLSGKEINTQILSKELGMGTGCSTCIKAFDQWKDKI